MSANERPLSLAIANYAGPFLAASYGLKTLARLATDPPGWLVTVPIDGPGRRRSGFFRSPSTTGCRARLVRTRHITSDEDR